MNPTHDFFVEAAKSFGLFYLIALSIGITVYAYWPSLGGRFDRAAKSILDDGDSPAPIGDPSGLPDREQEKKPCR